jgi:succinoglycan biosynthesis protein ExoV
MRLYYYKDSRGNFGDDLNPRLWSRLVGDLLDEDGRTLLLGIGTILNGKIPSSPGKVVFGSGIGYGAPPRLDGHWRVYCVRGPRTAAALGLPADAAVTDPAVLVRRWMPPLLPGDRRGVVLVPHHESIERARARGLDLSCACEQAGVTLVDPAGGLEMVLESLRHSELVLAEAMHAAILADAFRVPWVPLRIFDHILTAKWLDWTESLGVPYQPANISAPHDSSVLADFLTGQASQGRRQLSDEAVLGQKVDELLYRLDELKRDHRAGRLPVGPPARPEQPGEPSWWCRVDRALDQIAQSVPGNEPMLLIDDAQWPVDRPELQARVVPFPIPIDDRAALAEFDGHLQRGIRHVVIGWPSFWWQDHYPQFYRRVLARCRCTVRNDDLLIFEV